MQRLIVVLLAALAATSLALPSPGHTQHESCHETYDVVADQKCHPVHDKKCDTVTDQKCHTEHVTKYKTDQKCTQSSVEKCHTVTETDYKEECEDYVTESCIETHSSGYGGGYGKREAEPGHSYGPKCKQHHDRKCRKVPVHKPRQVCNSHPVSQCHPIQVPYTVPKQQCHSVPRQVCHTNTRQVCQHHERKVPRKVCTKTTVTKSYHQGYSHGGYGGY